MSDVREKFGLRHTMDIFHFKLDYFTKGFLSLTIMILSSQCTVKTLIRTTRVYAETHTNQPKLSQSATPNH